MAVRTEKVFLFLLCNDKTKVYARNDFNAIYIDVDIDTTCSIGFKQALLSVSSSADLCSI